MVTVKPRRIAKKLPSHRRSLIVMLGDDEHRVARALAHELRIPLPCIVRSFIWRMAHHVPGIAAREARRA